MEVTSNKIPDSKISNNKILVTKDFPESGLTSLRAENYAMTTVRDINHALQSLEKNSECLILCAPTKESWQETTNNESIKNLRPAPVFIIATEPSLSEHYLATLPNEFCDLISLPVQPQEVLFAVKKCLQRRLSAKRNRPSQINRQAHTHFGDLVSKNPRMIDIFQAVEKIAPFSTTVLLQGESGTGKELIARAIHQNSPRATKPFIAINCGAIPEHLLETELFGHRKGAFTDAVRDRKGLFEEASGGTMLLDEVGELPLHLQVKLLRVLQEGEIRPVGDERAVKVDVRLIAATLRDLENDVLEGRFRDDLFYRLNVISLELPPLRERKEDIPLLIEHFLLKISDRLGLPYCQLSEDALDALTHYHWPGNIRELENYLERAIILADEPLIRRDNLPPMSFSEDDSIKQQLSIADDELSIKIRVRNLEEGLIRRALQKTKGNRTHAAKLLEISHRTLLYKLKEFGISGEDEEKPA